ncbi:MAG: multi-sensor hybrid histidine kinase [uncultured bacterium]|nr:MAG: multi-sensor hybrid histidine kinase [uncultured bacterium]
MKNGFTTALDILLLALIITPTIYFIVLKPFRKQIALRKKAEEALRSSEAHLHTLVQTIPDYIWLKDENGIYLTCNRQFEKFFGAAEMDIIGKTDYDYVDKELADSFRMNDKRAMDANGPSINEEWITLADGKTRLMLETIKMPMKDETGMLIGVLGIGRDITQRKMAEEEILLKNKQLQSVQAEREKLFSIIVHDLKSPFNSFLGMTQLLSEELQNFSMAEIQEMATCMNTSAENLYSLLENLLLWAKSERGMIPFNPVEIKLLPFIREGVEIMEDSAKAKDISIKVNVNEDIVAFTDGNILQTIIRNLISNSVKFTMPGGSITVSAKKGGDSAVELSVKDTGIGMDENIKASLFKIDTHAGRQGTEGEPSTGLGLVVCKDFVEMLGGELKLESEPGKGSCFYFTIPDKHLK